MMQKNLPASFTHSSALGEIHKIMLTIGILVRDMCVCVCGFVHEIFNKPLKDMVGEDALHARFDFF